ncbi:hypothetical protein [Heyndrickxia camelliae]|uniref:Uncharacterized protein n=1 Tax=Heyndrickxia camelliae TaxID=1707093 RepID=A0A2N3LG71_9BACI|nr:hypothetical protein [Heyndrickxia camelliae]PKR83513.1 hypothetical protein CWO92_18275 [Heyndrickxia camelliae]
MNRERWVLKTNHNRYVSIPYILSGGFRSYLDDKPVWNKTRTFHSQEEAEEYLEKYLSPSTPYYVDRYSFKDGEKLETVEKVFV